MFGGNFIFQIFQGNVETQMRQGKKNLYELYTGSLLQNLKIGSF